MSSSNTVWVLRIQITENEWIVGEAYTSMEMAKRAQQKQMREGRTCEIAPAKLNRC